MNKSNHKFKDIDEYHSTFAEDIQKILQQLRQTIKESAPKAVETISYGMPAFKQNKVLVYYAVHKGHIGFYPTPNAIVHFKSELKKYKTSKGAIQFPLDKPLPWSLIKKMVEFRINEDTTGMSTELLGGVVHEVPKDMESAMKADREIIQRWNHLTPIQRNEWICWVTLVKRPETREGHIHRMTEELKEGKRQPCCWPGCPHRKTYRGQKLDSTIHDSIFEKNGE